MLDDILDFKNSLNDKIKDQSTNLDESIEILLEQFERNYSITIGEKDGHWKNYIHAVCVSTVLENYGYNLSNWQTYFNSAALIGDFIGPGTTTEWKVFELFVLHSINFVFDFGPNPQKIKAFVANDDANPTYLTDDTNKVDALTQEVNERLIGNIKTVMKIRGMPKKEIWGDNDIIVTCEENDMIQQFCIISCKLSLRERVYQSVFWSMHSRLQGVGKHAFITLDKGSNGRSEIGHRSSAPDFSARKSRDVLESTMDRVYVFRESVDVSRSAVIKDFHVLKNDLICWARDMTGN